MAELTDAQRATLEAQKTKLEARRDALETQLLRSLENGGVTSDSWTSAAGGTRSTTRLSPEILDSILGRILMRIDKIERILNGDNIISSTRIRAREHGLGLY